MKSKNKMVLICIFFGILLSVSMVPAAVAQSGNGVPTQEQVFIDSNGIGHNLTENNFDIMVHNDSHWEVSDPSMGIDNMTTWLNNTWNIKWIKEGNFEMMFLAFMNKSGDDSSPNSKYVTPAQFWAMHYSLNGHEIIIANMLSAWFGFNDADHNRNYTQGENLQPFFMMSTYNPQTIAQTGINMIPDVTNGLLNKSVDGNNITYTWWLNYTNPMFYLPTVNQTDGSFETGFNYSDPGTYLNGSFGVGVFSYVYYKYTLTIDTTAGQATLKNDYQQGPIKVLKMYNDNTSTWYTVNPGDKDYMPSDWALCVGNWAMIMTAQDQNYSLLDTSGSVVNASTAIGGLTTVKTEVSGEHAFDFAFSQKPNYEVSQRNNLTNTTTDSVVYQSLDINGNKDFLNLVSGMTQLIGPFARLFISYMVNQTNNFVNGISFDDAWNHFDPNSSAAMFISCYPKYGEYQGGLLNHDPTFVAYFTSTEKTNTNTGNNGIPGYSINITMSFILIGLISVIIKVRKKFLFR